MIFEIAQQAFQLFFHLANLGLLLFPSLSGELRFLAIQFLFARLQTQAFVFRLAQIGMQLVEKLPHVASLRPQPRPRVLDDGRIQA